jgi:hypothetical protein
MVMSKVMSSAVFLAGVFLSACTEPNPFYIGPMVVQCQVSRQECTAEQSDANGVSCASFSAAQNFMATACGTNSGGVSPNDLCKQKYCTQPTGVAYGYPSNTCSATGTDVTNQIHGAGACNPPTGDSNSHLALISVTRRWRDCGLAQGGGFCQTLSTNGNSERSCFDISKTGALTLLQPPSDTRDRAVLISSMEVNSGSCPLVGSTTSPLKYDMTAGNIGTATGGGTSATLTVKSGFAAASTLCDSSTCVTTVDRLVVNLADATVAGLPITGVQVASTAPMTISGLTEPDSGLQPIAAGGVKLQATGRVNGVDSFFSLTNHTSWLAKATATAINLTGSLDMVVTDASGKPLPVRISITAAGTPASAQTQACIGLSPTQRLFGFEDPSSWRSTAASLSLVTSPITQGCAALGISGQGYMPINGAPFSTSGLAPKAALSTDLFIPGNQPNPFWLGALQMYLSCPSGNVFNQYIGQAELTGKPTGSFSTLRFPLPAATLQTLGRPLDDCSIGFALNVNQTGRTWILDNLRFTP